MKNKEKIAIVGICLLIIYLIISVLLCFYYTNQALTDINNGLYEYRDGSYWIKYESEYHNGTWASGHSKAEIVDIRYNELRPAILFDPLEIIACLLLLSGFTCFLLNRITIKNDLIIKNKLKIGLGLIISFPISIGIFLISIIIFGIFHLVFSYWGLHPYFFLILDNFREIIYTIVFIVLSIISFSGYLIIIREIKTADEN
jgi:hypothetical protein